MATVPDHRAAKLGMPIPLLKAIKPEDLLYFVLNVGDADAQLLVLPEGNRGRKAVVVDVGLAKKMGWLVDDLTSQGFLSPVDTFSLVIGTHPHADHIGGMAAFVRRYAQRIREYWDPAYAFPSKSFANTQAALAANPTIKVVEPSSTTTAHEGQVAFRVLGPSARLRSQYDVEGVDPNDSSLVVMVEYPASKLLPSYSLPPNDLADVLSRRVPVRRTNRLLLGADAQTTSWSHINVDFPQLKPGQSWVGRSLRVLRGADALEADVLKVAHHGSKHGVNLELIERVRPVHSIVSSAKSGQKYNFPHQVAQEIIREGLDETAVSGAHHRPDDELKIHYTCATDDANQELGTIAVVIGPERKNISVFRLGDRQDARVLLDSARICL
jgi:beta-lactamase superfamily II metal-dependent hydrolase